MKTKNKLSKLQNLKVFINEDMSKEERVIQGKIRKKAKEENASGKNVKLGFQKLIINNEKWTWNIEKRRSSRNQLLNKLQKTRG